MICKEGKSVSFIYSLGGVWLSHPESAASLLPARIGADLRPSAARVLLEASLGGVGHLPPMPFARSRHCFAENNSMYPADLCQMSWCLPLSCFLGTAIDWPAFLQVDFPLAKELPYAKIGDVQAICYQSISCLILTQGQGTSSTSGANPCHVGLMSRALSDQSNSDSVRSQNIGIINSLPLTPHPKFLTPQLWDGAENFCLVNVENMLILWFVTKFCPKHWDLFALAPGR